MLFFPRLFFLYSTTRFDHHFSLCTRMCMFIYVTSLSDHAWIGFDMFFDFVKGSLSGVGSDPGFLVHGVDIIMNFFSQVN